MYYPKCAALVPADRAPGVSIRLDGCPIPAGEAPGGADPDRDNNVRAIYSWLITHSAGQDKLYFDRG